MWIWATLLSVWYSDLFHTGEYFLLILLTKTKLVNTLQQLQKKNTFAYAYQDTILMSNCFFEVQLYLTTTHILRMFYQTWCSVVNQNTKIRSFLSLC